jgi:hypothetical protein
VIINYCQKIFLYPKMACIKPLDIKKETEASFLIFRFISCAITAVIVGHSIIIFC